METSLVALGCCALANDAQTAAYARNLGCAGLIRKSNCCGCDFIPDVWSCIAQMEAEYTTPAGDYAIDIAGPLPTSIRPWWYDPLIAESGDVAGIWITSMEGFDSTEAIETSPTLTGGLAFGIGREAGRCVTVTGWIDSTSCCGARYMVQALQRRLADGCDDSVFVQQCCPTSATDSRHTLELPGARLTSGVKVLDRRGRCCPRSCSGSAIKVQWTWCFPHEDMIVGKEVVCEGSLGPVTDCACDITYWVQALLGTDVAGCGCVDPTVTPAIPANPCCADTNTLIAPLPKASVQGCYSPPLNFGITACNMVSEEKFYKHILTIEITAGAVPLTNVRIAAFKHTYANEPCATTAAEYLTRYKCQTPMVDVRIPSMAAHETITLDGVARTITQSFPGTGDSPAWSQVEVGPDSSSQSVMQNLNLGTCPELCVYIITECPLDTQGAEYRMTLRPTIQASF